MTKGAGATFEIDDILKELAEKEQNKTEVTAYLDRFFLDGMIAEYYDNLPETISTLFAQTQVNINEYNFTGADFRGVRKKDFDLFDFSNCDISSVHIDREGLEFFKEYIRKQTIKYVGLSVEGSNLSPKYYDASHLGIRCLVCSNLTGLNLSGMNFKNCDLEDVIFDQADINMVDFSGSYNMDAKQFAYAKNFEMAIFFEDEKEDNKFREKISKLSKIATPAIEPYFTLTHNPLAMLFDPPDPIRLDDPGYIELKKKVQTAKNLK